jgi:hypothetical protein
LQTKAYSEYGTKHELDIESAAKSKKSLHVFQVIQYMLRLCTHPMLAVKPGDPYYNEFAES